MIFLSRIIKKSCYMEARVTVGSLLARLQDGEEKLNDASVY